MAVLGKLLALLIPPILGWAYATLSQYLRRVQAARKASEEIRTANAKVREQAEKAQTEKEREDAAAAARRHF